MAIWGIKKIKTRYKIILIGICIYFAVFFTPVIASNVYCDFISQEMCTSRIKGVTLPSFNMISSSISSDNECYFENDDGSVVPCHNAIGEFEWPFPPRMLEHPQECIEICPDT